MATIYEYQCLIYSQRPANPNVADFCLFHAPVRDILAWADIRRLETREGQQRSRNDAKVRAVRRFLAVPDNTIPTAVVLSLNLPTTARITDNGATKLRFEYETGAPQVGLVIDGQHRLLGAQAYQDDMQLNVVALMTGDADEAAFQFMVINQKASRVATDHIRNLFAQRTDTRFRDRLLSARLSVDKRYDLVELANEDAESPFRQEIDWPTTPEANRLVKPAAVHLALRELQEREGVREFSEDDTLLDFFFAIWQEVKSQWAGLWVANSKLISKVGIAAMTKYVADSAVNSFQLGELEITDPTAVRSRVRALLAFQTRDFWTGEWSLTGMDNPAGRKAVADALVQINLNLRGGRPWDTDVKLLHPTVADAD
jgi:DGQHR domain-containing protein